MTSATSLLDDDGYVTDDAVDRAEAAIRGHVARTPVVRSTALSDALDADVHFKCELFQPTGSFKVRGVFNKASQLTAEERDRGLIAFSAGNHAMAVGHVGVGLGLPVTVCMPAGAVQFKVDAVRALGASLELVDGDLVAHALARQAELGATMVHPFDDPAIVAGTATIGREIVADLPDVDTVIVPVGGGGLISGLATGVKRARPGTRVIGVEPDSADVVSRSLAAGAAQTLDRPSSLADGLAAPSTGEINLHHIRRHVDDVVVVAESALADAWARVVRMSKLAVEPAVAAAMVALDTGAIEVAPGETVCIVASGGTADFAMLG